MSGSIYEGVREALELSDEVGASLAGELLDGALRMLVDRIRLELDEQPMLGDYANEAETVEHDQAFGVWLEGFEESVAGMVGWTADRIPTCGYCGEIAKRVKGRDLFFGSAAHKLRNKLYWECPKCASRVGCKPDGSPLGTLADLDTRVARTKAHDAFDPVWKKRSLGYMVTRGEAYEMLARDLDLPVEEAHIGLFDRATCEKVERIVRGWQS